MLTASIAATEQHQYGLDEAVTRGVVDINFNPWTKRSITPLIEHLAELDVGMINRLGFQYGGHCRTFEFHR